MAWVLAGPIWHLGAFTLRGGIITGALVWLGFVVTTLAVTTPSAYGKPALIWIDGGHWLVVLLLMGAIWAGWVRRCGCRAQGLRRISDSSQRRKLRRCSVIA